MESIVIAEFDSRRAAELAVERVVQECGIPRDDVFVQTVGAANSSGTRPAGADAKTKPQPEPGEKLKGPLQVSVNYHGDDPKDIADALKAAGANAVRTR